MRWISLSTVLTSDQKIVSNNSKHSKYLPKAKLLIPSKRKSKSCVQRTKPKCILPHSGDCWEVWIHWIHPIVVSKPLCSLLAPLSGNGSLWAQFSSVQSLSRVQLFATPWTAAHQASLPITNSQSLLTLMSIESVMLSKLLILCHPLLLISIFPRIRVFSNESALLMRWSNYWSFSFNTSPSSEYSGLISFRIDCLDLVEIQGALKSLLQHHSSKASVLQHSAFFTVQLSHPYITNGKTIALTRQIFVGKVMSLLFNMLSRLVITFLPRSKHLLISWLQSPSAVILEPQKINSATVSTVSPSICHEVMGPDAMIFIFWMLNFKPTFSLSSFTFIESSLNHLHFLP